MSRQLRRRMQASYNIVTMSYNNLGHGDPNLKYSCCTNDIYTSWDWYVKLSRPRILDVPDVHLECARILSGFELVLVDNMIIICIHHVMHINIYAYSI